MSRSPRVLKKILVTVAYVVILGILGFVVFYRFMRGCSMFVPH
jgi:hypothetical protein